MGVGARERTPTTQKNVNPSGPYISLSFVRFFPSEKTSGAVNQTSEPPDHRAVADEGLAAYGVRSKSIWIGNEAAKGYMMNDFEEAFKRYIPRSEWEALKAEWRVEEEGRKAAGAGGKPEGSDQKPKAGTHGSAPGRAGEDDAAGA